MKYFKYLLFILIVICFSYVNLFPEESGVLLNSNIEMQNNSGLNNMQDLKRGTNLLQQKSLQNQPTLPSDSSTMNKFYIQKEQSIEGENQQSQNNANMENQNIGEIYKKKISQIKKLYPKKDLSKYSSLEKSFYNLTKVSLEQFGYNFFNGQPRLTFSIPVDKNYVLGPGDELFLYIIGSSISSNLTDIKKLVVDREGKIYLPGVGVFYVWGLTIGNTESLISKALSANIKLTLGRLRTFPVYVSGEVNRPGAVMVTGVNTVIDALMMAGGIKKTGTLRDIIVTRKLGKNIKKFHIDFYKLLLKGEQIDFRLRDNDVIFVKTIGKTVGITGKVKRPAIYEIKGKTTIKDLINLSGGLLPSSYNYKVTLERYKNNLYIKLIEGELSNKKFMETKLQDGDIIDIKSVLNGIKNAIEIKGYTPYQGFYQYKKNMELSNILTKDLFYSDTNIDFAVIKRQFPPGSIIKFITFSPKLIFNKKEDISLKAGDTIILYKFGEKQIDFNKIKNVVVLEGEVLYPGVYAFKKGMKLSDIFKKDIITMNTDLNYGEIERRDPTTFKLINIIRFIPKDILNRKHDKILHRFDVIRLFPRNVFSPIKISGEVKKSIVVPYHFGIKLIDALSKVDFSVDLKKLKVEIFREVFLNAPNASNKMNRSISELEKAENIKGMAESAQDIISKNLNSIFLYNLLIDRNPKLNIPLNPGDRLLIKKVSKSEVIEKVEVQGYVQKPGIYPISEKTTLYDILKQAGGFRKNAYPEGIIFTREMIKKMQQQRLTKAIFEMRQEIEKEQAGIMQSDLPSNEKSARMESFEAKRRLLNLMSNTKVNGRISGLVIPKDINKLKDSISNIFLMNGDKIYVPKRPASVMVFGEVYNPTALVMIHDNKVKDYISDAGGLTKDADKENIFVIKSNGAVVTSSNMYKSRHWDGRNPKIWGIPFLFSKNIMNYKLDPGDAIIVPLKVNVPIFWRPLIKDVMQIVYQTVLTSYTIIHLNN